MLEKDIQSKIMKALTKAGYLVLRPVAVSKSGYPDLWCLKSGVLVFVEVKQPGDHPTKLQEHRHRELAAQGFTTVVATSVNCVDRVEAVYNSIKQSLRGMAIKSSSIPPLL